MSSKMAKTPSQDQAWRPCVIHLTSRTRRPRCDISTNIVMYLQILSISRCVTCSGQKCLHVNIYVNIYEFPMGEYCHSAIFHACSIIAEIFIQLYCPNTLASLLRSLSSCIVPILLTMPFRKPGS